ncbi:MAG TPA: ABC transporter permease [Geobacterales bacterium]|nr:ABC transporter permease [Geobacterales bacterium]
MWKSRIRKVVEDVKTLKDIKKVGSNQRLMKEQQNLGYLHGIWALTNRELKKWYKAPVILIISLIQPIAWLLLFGKSMNLGSMFSSSGFNIPGLNIPKQVIDQIANQILLERFGTTDYFSYLAVGMVAFIMLFTAMSSGMTIVWDRRLGFLNKLLTTPISRATIVFSKTLSSVLRALTQATIVLIVATLLGMQFKAGFGVLDLLLSYAALFLMAMGLASLFIMLAIRATSWESQMAVMNLLNLPLMFASNAFYPISTMPSWLQPVAYINPITYTNDILRQLMLGATGIKSLAFDFMYLSAFGILFTAIGMILSWRYLSK